MRLSARPRRTRGWRRRVLVLSLLLLAAAVGTGWYVTRPARLAGYLADALAQVTGAEVHLDAAHLLADGQVDLENLALRVPGVEGEGGKIFEAASVRVDLGLGELITGRVRIESLVLLRPTLYLTQDLTTGRYNYEALRLPEGQDDEAESLLPETLPRVALRHGTVQFGQLDAHGRFESLGARELEGHLAPWEGRSGAYYFDLRQQLPEGESAARLDGTLDLRRQQVSVQLSEFRFSPDQVALLPMQVRKLWSRLDPAGSLPRLTVRYDPDADERVHAEFEVDGVALTLPVPEMDARLSDVTGRFVLDDDRLTIDQLTGVLEGIRYQIAGVVHGLDLDAPVNLHLKTEPFVVPEDPPHLAGLPPAAQKHYHRFAPHGTFQVELDLVRHTKGGDLSYTGTIDLLGVTGRYHKFPFVATDLRGRIRLSDQEVVIEKITGRGLTGGELTMEGTIAPPGDRAEVDLTVTADDIPLDRHLLEAMEPKHRKVFQMFFNEPSHRALVERGVVRSAEPTLASLTPETPAWDAAPTFDLGGRIDATIHITREPGPNHPNLVTTALRGEGVRVLFEHWPYPLSVGQGEVVIAPGEVLVKNVHLHGPTGAKGVIRGRVAYPDRQRGVERTEIDLHIADAHFPVDELLLASIPEPQDQWVRQLQVAGALATEGRVFTDPATGEPDFAIDLTLTDARAQPNGGDFALDPVTGKLALTRSQVTLEQLTGQRGDGALHAKGTVAWDATDPRCDLRFTAENLAIEPAIIDLLPPGHDARARITALMKRYRPTGRLDATLVYRRGETTADASDDDAHDDAGQGAGHDASRDASPAERYTLTLAPRALAFDLGDQRVELTNMTGQVALDGEQVELRDVAARSAHGSLKVSGLMGLGDAGGAALQINAEADRIDTTTRALLPEAARQVVDALALHGGYALREARLLWRPTVTQGPQLEFEGKLALRGAGATVGVPITDLEGVLDLRVVRFANVSTPHLDLNLRAERLRAADRLIAPLTLHLLTDPGRPDVLRIEELHGQIYDGVLTGEGELQVRRRGWFRVDLALQDALIEPFLDAPRQARDAAASQPAATRPDDEQNRGRLSASLSLEAVYGRPATRRGRGALEVVDARLFERPLTIALLQAANLTLPTADSFDRAAARFLVEGDTVHFDTIRFETPSVAIAGSGTMDYATQELDLTLFARDAAGPRFGAISEMINVFKDQLICIAVRGTLAKPDARMVSFEGLRRSWEELFGPPPPRQADADPPAATATSR